MLKKLHNGQGVVKMIYFIRKYEFPLHLLVGWAIVCTKVATFVGTGKAKLILSMLGCRIGKGFRVDGRLGIWAQRKGAIRIGDNVMINSRFGANFVGLSTPTVFQCLEGGSISIGDNSGLTAAMLSARSSIVIGQDVKIGRNVRIFDHDHHSMNFIKRRGKELSENIKPSPVEIGNDVFIGTNAIILKGVSVGDRAIIGAGAVVRCDVPADEIWAGNPAVCVRQKVRS